MKRAAIFFALAFGGAVPSLCAAVQGPAYPNKSVRLVVPYAPGGAADTIGRMLSRYMGQILGQPFIVENKGGAQGAIGAVDVAKSAPDGYTLLLFDSGVMGTSTLLDRVDYDPVKDFKSVGRATVSPYMVTANANFPAKNLKELASIAKSKPGQINLASGSATSRLSGELFQMLAGVKMMYVPYKGGAPLMNDLMGGHVDISVAAAPSTVPFVASGKVRALAVTGEKRLSALPDVMTSKESGYPEFIVMDFNGIAAPMGTPPEVIAILHSALAKAVGNPDVVQKLKAGGFEASVNSPSEMDGLIKSELVRWKKVVDASGIKKD